jgi:iron complex outermembrane receptor protein
LLLAGAAIARPFPVLAQGEADSVRADSARRVAAMRVTVTRTNSDADRAPWALGVVSKGEIQGARATLGVDEALSSVPGVVVSNRYNYSVDQRLSIRGAGARANFGMRGVKVLLDGVPQSLPDGQSQLTNIDLGDISRVEVLRGSASSLYGNGSGGVIAFTTDLSAPDPFTTTLRTTGGSFGLRKWQSRTSGRAGPMVGSLSFSRTTVDGARQYSRADLRQLMAAADWSLADGTTLAFRAALAETPTALNPGALTAAEYARNRDSAAAINIARGASRAISQNQFSVRASRDDAAGGGWSATAYVVRRFVDNPLATTPAGASVLGVGTYSTINRWVMGARVDVSERIGRGAEAPRVSAGLDAQRSTDIRRNWRATGGHPSALSDTLLLFQDEIVTSIGPFGQVSWSPLRSVQLDAGVRWDQLRFEARDHFLADKVDNSGVRTMTAATGHLGASWSIDPAFTPYANWSSAFETPTTTELNARSDGAGGFNPDLGPQRVRTAELGARGRRGALAYTVSLFESYADDAIIQYLALDGRAFFRNAGRTRHRGTEVGVQWQVASWLAASGSWTEADYRFVRYLVPRGAVTDTLDGKREAGVPARVVRIGLDAHLGAATLALDHTWSDAQYADDKNTQRVDGYGPGVLNVRAGWTGAVGAMRVAPFAGVNNAMNRAYVGAVTINGAAGRVLEPAPLRNYYLGVELGWRAASGR